MRDLVAETTFSVANLIQPLFIVDGMTGSEPIAGLGDNARLEPAATVLDVRSRRDLDAGVRHFLLFAVPAAKRSLAISRTCDRRAVDGRDQEADSAIALNL